MFQITESFTPSHTSGRSPRNAAINLRHRMFTFAWRFRKDNVLFNDQAWSFDTETAKAPIERLNKMLAEFSTFHEPPAGECTFLWKCHGPSFEIWFATFKGDPKEDPDDSTYIVISRFKYATEAISCKMVI